MNHTLGKPFLTERLGPRRSATPCRSGRARPGWRSLAMFGAARCWTRVAHTKVVSRAGNATGTPRVMGYSKGIGLVPI